MKIFLFSELGLTILSKRVTESRQALQAAGFVKNREGSDFCDIVAKAPLGGGGEAGQA